eukprot:TRINITY_DN34220_c0_g1_i2.p1 TRINITY_DN34220_c0_g1~~TRINITY_DN34220_c0_g1_i2.p1  ORF type:complete len:344 (-),score=32.78 TRINITY_DN34220_c0_g1_i2:103-1134(-)
MWAILLACGSCDSGTPAPGHTVWIGVGWRIAAHSVFNVGEHLASNPRPLLFCITEEFRRVLVKILRARKTLWGLERHVQLDRMRKHALLEFLAPASQVAFLVAGWCLIWTMNINDWIYVGFYIHTIGILILSGAFQKSSKQESVVVEHDNTRRQRRLETALAYQVSSDNAWQAQVEDMAGRAFTLRALLDFYRELPTTMKHFDARTHTTNDVVREAIIPGSKETRSAYPTKMMNGQHIRPDVMITHNWGNLFKDLCAVMVAHVLSEPDFGMVAHLLEVNRLDTIEAMLPEDAWSVKFWVCAFCVNQHRSICGKNPAHICERFCFLADEASVDMVFAMLRTANP